MKYSIRVKEINNGSENLKGIASVVLGDSFRLDNIMILNNSSKNQLYVSMPSHKTNQVDENGKPVYQEYFNPITKEFRDELYSNILGAFTELRDHQAGKTYRVEINENETTMPELAIRVTPYEKEGSNIKGLASVKLEISTGERTLPAQPRLCTLKYITNKRAVT